MSSPKWLLSASMSPGKFPVASCFSRRFSKISKWDWLRLLSLPASVLEILHTTFKAKFLFFTALWLSCMWALLAFRPDILRIYLPSENPEARKPNAGFKQLSPWGEFLQLLLSLIFRAPTWWCDLDYAFLPLLLVFLHLVVERSFLLVLRSFPSIFPQ